MQIDPTTVDDTRAQRVPSPRTQMIAFGGLMATLTAGYGVLFLAITLFARRKLPKAPLTPLCCSVS